MDIHDARDAHQVCWWLLWTTRFRCDMACVGEFGDIELSQHGYHDAGGGRIFHFPDHRTAHPCF